MKPDRACTKERKMKPSAHKKHSLLINFTIGYISVSGIVIRVTPQKKHFIFYHYTEPLLQ